MTFGTHLGQTDPKSILNACKRLGSLVSLRTMVNGSNFKLGACRLPKEFHQFSNVSSNLW